MPKYPGRSNCITFQLILSHICFVLPPYRLFQAALLVSSPQAAAKILRALSASCSCKLVWYKGAAKRLRIVKSSASLGKSPGDREGFTGHAQVQFHSALLPKHKPLEDVGSE